MEESYHEEIYKNYRIKIEIDTHAANPFEEYDFPKGMGLVTRDRNWLYGDYTADEFNKLKDKSKYYWLPVYKLDHGSVAYNTTGFECPWDSGHTGYIYIPKNTAINEWKTEEDAFSYMRSHVDMLSMYANGEVFGYILEEEESCTCGEHTEWMETDSCWGYYGFDDAINQAKYQVDCYMGDDPHKEEDNYEITLHEEAN